MKNSAMFNRQSVTKVRVITDLASEVDNIGR